MLKARLLQHWEWVGRSSLLQQTKPLKIQISVWPDSCPWALGVPRKESCSMVTVTGKAVFRRGDIAEITLKINSILGVGREVEKIVRKTKCEKRGHTFHRDKR